MRLASLLVVALLALGGSARAAQIHPVNGPTLASTTVALQAAQAPQTPKAQVDINVHHGGGRWYASPVWIAIGVLALIVIILLIVVAARGGGGGGTTIVRG